MTGTRPLVGRTTLTGRALRALVTGLARDVGQVAKDDVTVAIQDLDGNLALTVALPFVVLTDAPQSLPDRGRCVRDHLITGVRDLASRTAGTVDIRFTAVRRADRRRAT